MNQDTITCPNCGQEFELSDALTGHIREHLRGELLQEVSRREEKLKKQSESLKAQAAQISRGRAEIDEEIARMKLKTMGVKIDKLTFEQKKYLADWKEGT